MNFAVFFFHKSFCLYWRKVTKKSAKGVLQNPVSRDKVMVWGIVRFLGGHFLDRKTEGQEFLDMQPFVRKALRGERSLQPTAIGVGPAPLLPATSP